MTQLTGLAADLEFAGGLERVTQQSILIRLARGDRIAANLPKTGDLSSERISAQFHLADEIQITCKPKDQGHCTDLRSIRFLRPPTERERFLLLGSPAPSTPPDPELERIRQVNLEHAKNMPSFIASETARRYTSPRSADPPVWRLKDIVEADIVFKDGEPTRERIRINGKPLIRPQIPGVNWDPFFGTEIKMVFDPKCPTDLAFSGREEANGKQLLAYAFASPPDGCWGWWQWGANATTPAELGECS